MTPTEPQAAAHATSSFDLGKLIVTHITDSHEIEIPFTHAAIHLPQWHVFGYDLSITRHVVMLWIAAAVFLGIGAAAGRAARNPVPSGWRNALEVFITYFRDSIARRLIGPEGDRYLPYLLTCFFLIWTGNLMELVPGMATPTADVGVTAALAGIAFIVIQLAGIRKNGLLKHLRYIVPGGLPLWLYPLMIPIEILSMFAKPFALCIRLFANMTAGDVLIIGMISLIFIIKSVWMATLAVPFTLFIMMLELLVCVIQAYIFTTLVATFIGMTVHPAH